MPAINLTFLLENSIINVYLFRWYCENSKEKYHFYRRYENMQYARKAFYIARFEPDELEREKLKKAAQELYDLFSLS